MILDKAKMAHEWAMKHGNAETIGSRQNMVKYAWEYADLMQAEADKRVKQKAIDDAKASKIFMDSLTNELEWQPDWSQAPEWAVAWTKDNGGTLWWDIVPEMRETIWSLDGIYEYTRAPSFNYQGDWRESLRKRP